VSDGERGAQHRGLSATRRGLVLAENVLSGCLWVVVLGVAAIVAGLVSLWVPAAALPVGAGATLVGVGLLWALARDRRRKTEATLSSRPGHRRYPNLLRPLSVPMSTWTSEGVTRIWRVHGVVPNGRAATAEVMVEVPTGSSFVAWGADRPRPPAARDLQPVLSPVVPGCVVAASDPEATAARLAGLTEQVAAVVPEDGHLAVYPFGIWWRVVGPVTPKRLAAAEASLIALGRQLA